MTAARLFARPALALAALAIGGASAAADLNRAAGGGFASLAAASALYELADRAPVTSLRWDPLTSTRLELAAGLLPRHEVRLSAGLAPPGPPGPGGSADTLLATYRYTFFAQRDWAWKVGVTAPLGESSDPARRWLGARPLLHFAGEARLTPNWSVDFGADGLLTVRRRALDVGLRVNYALSRSFSLYGGYRFSDQALEGEDNGHGMTNAANFGLRYRF
jgi:hypothetical protein